MLFSGEVEGEKRKNILASLKIIQALSVVMSASYHQVALLRWEKHSIWKKKDPSGTLPGVNTLHFAVHHPYFPMFFISQQNVNLQTLAKVRLCTRNS